MEMKDQAKQNSLSNSEINIHHDILIIQRGITKCHLNSYKHRVKISKITIFPSLYQADHFSWAAKQGRS